MDPIVPAQKLRPDLGGLSGNGGFSLIEILLTVGIIAILVLIAIPVMETLREQAEKTKCMSQMRTLHTCFVAHVQDKGSWPQLPTDDGGKWSEDRFYKFWITSLEPYGCSQETWLCPSDKLTLQFKRSELAKEERYFGTYVPTAFDDAPGSPFRWNQPWVVERGNFHGRGAHMLMPDGSIQDAQNPFFGR